MQRSPTCENCQKNYELREYQPIGPRIPLLLSCGHTFCEGCILKVARLHQEIACFICNKKQVLEPRGEKGVANLLPNIYMLGMLLFNRRAASACNGDRVCGGDINSFSGIGNVIQQPEGTNDTEETSLEAVSQNQSLICDECSSKEATCLCQKCDDSNFCDGCFVQIHRASKTLNKHTPLPLQFSSSHTLLCHIHEDRPLEFYDEELKQAVCARCIISDSCKGHKIVPFSEVDDEVEDLSLDDALEKAKETLSWFENSKRVLSLSLPDEVADSYQLVSDIQKKFSDLHTQLLKRQLEVMHEASKKVMKEANAHKQIQGITIKIKEIKRTIKDYDMIKDNKKVRKMKGHELLKKLQELADQPCIIQRTSLEGSCSFNIDEDLVNRLKSLGIMEEKTVSFSLIKSNELDEKTIENLKLQKQPYTNPNTIEENEVYEQKLVPKKITPLMGPQKGHHELVYITHVKDPLNFMVQRCADKDRLQVMMTALNKYCRHSNDAENRIYHVEEGNIICAQFSADDNWYRAQCISGFFPSKPDVVPSYNNNLPVEVLYIDYGNSEWLPLNRLRKIKDQFLEIPSMAVNCSLTDIVPPFKAVVWPERSIKAFNSLTGDRPMLMNIRERIPGKLLVDLRRPDDEEPTQDDDRPVSVRDALVFLDVACFFSPASFPNADIHKSVRDYPPHDLFKIDDFVDVTVTHIVDHNYVYIQRLDSPIMNEQTHLTKLYQGRNKRAWKIDWPYRNLVCAAKFSGDKTWYRAKVKHVNHDETVLVEYVDFGNEEILDFKDIKKIPDMYLKLQRQCLKVKLRGISDSLNEDDEMKVKVIEFFEKNVMNEALVCLTKELDEENMPVVCLFDTSTDQDININELAVQIASSAQSETSEKVEEEIEANDDDITSAMSSNSVSSLTSSNTDADERQKPLKPSQSPSQSAVAPTIPPPVMTPAFPQYLPPELPSTNEFEATGVFVDDDAVIYLHVMIDDFKLENIMQELNRDPSIYTKHPKNTSKLNVNQALLARFSQDGFWYRAKVLNIVSKTIVKVEFIDFGNSEEVHVNQLSTSPKFLIVPAQCVSVKLANIVQVGGTKASWHKVAINMLKERIEEKQLKIKTEGSKAFVIADNEDLSLMLVTNGYAQIKKNSNQRGQRTTEETPPERSKLCSPFEKLFSPITSPPDTPSKQDDSHSMTSTDSHAPGFSKQTLPDMGVRFDVTVTQVDRPNLVYIQRFPPLEGENLFADDSGDVTASKAYEEISELEELSYHINTEDFNPERITTKVVKGMPCIGRYSSDGQNYRAVVKSVDHEEGVVELVYVDYGTKETVPIESLKAIPPNLLSLLMQATKVEISGIQPLQCSAATGWPKESLTAFFKIVANKRLIGQILDNSGGIPKIHLYDRREDSNSGEMKDVLVAQIMADNNSSSINLNEHEKMFVEF